MTTLLRRRAGRVALLQLRGGALWLVIGVGVVLLVLIAAYVYTEVLWFQSVGYLEILRTRLVTQVAIVLVAFFAVAGFVFVNLWLAWRMGPGDALPSKLESPVERVRLVLEPIALPLIVLISVVVGLAFGLTALPTWQSVLLAFHRVDFGRTDPFFGKDLGYFVFQLKFLVLLNQRLMYMLMVTLVLIALAYFFFAGIRPQGLGVKVGWRTNVHLSVLYMCLTAVLFWGFLLERHLLSYDRDGAITGLDYTDIKAALAAYYVLSAVIVLVFVIFQLNVLVRGWALPAFGIVFLGIAALSLAHLYPRVYEYIVVDPQELTRNRPYIKDHLEMTRYGFGLDHVDVVRAPAQPRLSQKELRRRGAEVGARLWDPATLRVAYQQLQALRHYYTFPGIDEDRYDLGSGAREMLLGVREISQSSLPRDANTWINRRTMYTHGYGVVASPPAEADGSGMPIITAGGIPARGPKALSPRNPRVYYGQAPADRALVSTPNAAIDTPRIGGGYGSSAYYGRGGVKLDSALRRAAFALRFWQPKLLLSHRVRRSTRLLLYRQVRERAQRIAPFLKFDHDPYPVVSGDRLQWVVDAYTTSDMVPYARRVNLGDLTRIRANDPQSGEGDLPRELVRDRPGLDGTANYVRNSVKAVVDAYDGTVTFYATDDTDPVLKAWKRIFPHAFTPVEQAPPDLRRHFRYPRDLMRAQAVIWALYHMRSADAFYAKEDAWRIPSEADFISDRVARKVQERVARRADLRPYYLETRLPGQDKAEFLLAQPFSPTDRDVLSGYLAGRSDPGVLGKLTCVLFRPSETVFGPQQARSLIEQDPDISAWISLWTQSGSRVNRGRLLVLPVGGELLYVQGLFLQADKSEVSNLQQAAVASIPELKRVVAVHDGHVVMRSTLKAAISAVLAGRHDAARDTPLPEPRP